MTKLEVKYGLPEEIKYCKKCNMSNQQPMSSNEYKHGSNSKKETMSFHDDGICIRDPWIIIPIIVYVK